MGLFDDDSIIKHRTHSEIITLERSTVLSLPGIAFTSTSPDTDNLSKNIDEGYITADADGIFLLCPITLPDGAEVTEVIVYGNAAATAEAYYLMRVETATNSASQMGTANIGTADQTITHPVIDNGTFSYWVSTSSIDTNDCVYGVRIKFKWRT